MALHYAGGVFCTQPYIFLFLPVLVRVVTNPNLKFIIAIMNDRDRWPTGKDLVAHLQAVRLRNVKYTSLSSYNLCLYYGIRWQFALPL
jgi:hypothetical protein